MLVWLTLPFYDFCGFRSVAVNSVYKLQFFTFILLLLARLISQFFVLIVLAASVCRRRLLGSVTLYGRPADGFIRAGQAMTSCRLQSNYSSTVTLPVPTRPVLKQNLWDFWKGVLWARYFPASTVAIYHHSVYVV